jgi:hypothetical protein
MNWYIGQEIVCVKTHSQGAIKRGQSFKIKGLRNSRCGCKTVLIDIGYTDNKPLWLCDDCGRLGQDSSPVWWFDESLFAPLDQDISELTEILEQPIKQVQEL